MKIDSVINQEVYEISNNIRLARDSKGNYISLPIDIVKEITFNIFRNFNEFHPNQNYTKEQYEVMIRNCVKLLR